MKMKGNCPPRREAPLEGNATRQNHLNGHSGPSIRSVHFAWGLTTQGIWGQFLSCPMRHTHTQVSSPATSRHPPPNRPGKTGISLSPLSTPEC